MAKVFTIKSEESEGSYNQGCSMGKWSPIISQVGQWPCSTRFSLITLKLFILIQ